MRKLLVAEFDAGQLVRAGLVRSRQRHRHVKVVRSCRARAGEDRHDEARVHGVEDVGDLVLARQPRHRLGIGGIDVCRHQPTLAGPSGTRRRDRGPGSAQVIVRDDERLEEVPFDSDPGGGVSDPAGPDHEDPHELSTPRPASADESR